MPKLVRIKPGGNWYVAFTSGKRSRRVTTGTTDKLEAQKFLARVNAQLSKPPEPAQQTVSELLDAYLADRKGNVSAYATLEFAVKKLKPFFGAAQPRHVTIEMSKSYIQLHRKKQSDGTTRRELGTLRAAFEFGRRHKWYENSPSVEMPVAPEGRQRWLTRAEAEKLIAACKSPHIKAYMALGIHTGARKGAILDLTWDRVNMETGRIFFTRPGRPTSKKRRTIVPINATLRAVLEETAILAQSDWVVEWRDGPVLNIKHAFNDAVEAAGLDETEGRVTPHVLRHTCAAWLLQGGRSFAETAAFLGDSEKMIRNVYGHHHPDWLRDAANALEA